MNFSKVHTTETHIAINFFQFRPYYFTPSPIIVACVSIVLQLNLDIILIFVKKSISVVHLFQRVFICCHLSCLLPLWFSPLPPPPPSLLYYPWLIKFFYVYLSLFFMLLSFIPWFVEVSCCLMKIMNTTNNYKRNFIVICISGFREEMIYTNEAFTSLSNNMKSKFVIWF